MAYTNEYNNIISRPGYSGFGDGPIMPPPTATPSAAGKIGGAIKGLLGGIFGSPQPQMIIPQDQGVDPVILAVGAVAVVGVAYMLLRKKKA